VQPGYRVVGFTSLDKSGSEVYHTNVVLAVLERHLLCCLDAVTKQIYKDEIIECAKETQKELINLTHEEMNNFCGNII
jgi:hypothetical protein